MENISKLSTFKEGSGNTKYLYCNTMIMKSIPRLGLENKFKLRDEFGFYNSSCFYVSLSRKQKWHKLGVQQKP